MTGRERLQAILQREPADRLSWTTLVDDTTRSPMPDGARALPVLDFYRHIGCDILQFGNYGLPEGERVQFVRTIRPVEEKYSQSGDTVTHERITPWGTLTAVSRNGHPTKYPVESLEEIRLLARIWAESRPEEHPDARARCGRLIDAIRDDGLYCPTLPPSPVQHLIQIEMGLENFYYFLEDHPAEMAALLDAMQEGRKREYEITAQTAPVDTLIAVENTSTTLTSPEAYRKYSLPQVRDYADIAHRHGKKLVLHMCGRLHDLLEAIGETGADGINTLTPPETGDCTFEHALDVLGEDLVIMGGLLPPEVFHARDATKEDIWRLLDKLYTPRVRRAHFALLIQADKTPTPLWKFLAVREWMERNDASLSAEAKN